MRLADRFLHLDDLVVHLGIAARKERSAIDDHVDLVRTELDRVARLADLDVRGALS
jgi:hypothetical protein